MHEQRGVITVILNAGGLCPTMCRKHPITKEDTYQKILYYLSVHKAKVIAYFELHKLIGVFGLYI